MGRGPKKGQRIFALHCFIKSIMAMIFQRLWCFLSFFPVERRQEQFRMESVLQSQWPGSVSSLNFLSHPLFKPSSICSRQTKPETYSCNLKWIRYIALFSAQPIPQNKQDICFPLKHQRIKLLTHSCGVAANSRRRFWHWSKTSACCVFNKPLL